MSASSVFMNPYNVVKLKSACVHYLINQALDFNQIFIDMTV